MITAVLSVVHSANAKVAKSAVQTPPEGSGFDTFEFWLPERRPSGQLLAASFNPPIEAFAARQVQTGYARPFIQSNAWVADPKDSAPVIELRWNAPQAIRKVDLFFDVDYDHAMESVQYGHYDNAMPFCVKAFQIKDDQGKVLCTVPDNHQAMCRICFDEPAATTSLRIEILETREAPAALFAVRCYE